LYHRTFEDNAVYGHEDLDGLRVVANALYDDYFRDYPKAETRLAGTPPRPAGEGDARLAAIRRSVEELRDAGARFVLCYHVDGTADWALAYSAGLSRGEAVEELLKFVQTGLLFDPA
jgi:hypothetical protein